MRAVIQRVSQSAVQVDSQIVGEIATGLLVLLGVSQDDEQSDVNWISEKIATLRIFEDDEGKMNRSLLDIKGSALVVSQFTLFGDCRKGRRPSFVAAAPPEQANTLYQDVVAELKGRGIPVETGVFQAQMAVALVNEGPVTMLLDSRKTF